MTRTALGAPDDGPEDPNPEAWVQALSLASFPVILAWTDKTQETHLRLDPPLTIEPGDTLWLRAGSGKTETMLRLIQWKSGLLEKTRVEPHTKRPWYARVSQQRLAGLAVFIAGRKRAALGVEWHAHLSGENGAGLPESRQVREAAGFVLAAARCRLQDAADLAWWPVDAVLTSRGLSNLFVLLATLSLCVLFICQGGLSELADNLGSVAVVWGAAFGLIHVGRQWRDVKPLERKPRADRQ